MTNKTKEEKRLMFFDMQEYPERYSDEQVESLLADEDMKKFFCDMAMARMAQQKAHPDKVDVDEAWRAFVAAQHQPAGLSPRPATLRFKIAASIIGVVCLSAIALAAIHTGLLRTSAAGGDSTTPTEQPVTKADTAKTDTTQTMAVAQADSLSRKPVVFDNAELGTVMTQLAAFYHAKVVFEHEEARHVRVFFNWDKTKTLRQNLDILNAFERIQITEDHGTLKVE